MADATGDKFSYTGPTPANQQMDLTGEREAARRADIMDKSRMMTIPPRQTAEVKEGGFAGDKRSADEIAMDAEIARLQEVDRPAQATLSPLDAIGPGMARVASRAAPELMAALARTMRRAPEPEKPAPLPEYGPLRDNRYGMSAALEGDIRHAQQIPERIAGYIRNGSDPRSIAEMFADRGYSLADVLRYSGAGR